MKVMVKVGLIGNFIIRNFRTLTLYSGTSRSNLVSVKVSEKLNVKVELGDIIGMAELKPEQEFPSVDNVFKVTPDTFDSLVKLGAETLKAGGVIAIPTDTIYGIAADAQNDDAIRRIYQIKGRDCQKPISICLNRQTDFHKWAKVHVKSELLCDLLPGPLTLVFERTPSLNPNLNPGTNLIGIRIPDFRFVDSLVSHFDGPVALTSANPSSAPSTLAVEEFKELWSSLDHVFDAGRLPILDSNRNPSLDPQIQLEEENVARLGSTVIDVSEVGYFRIIRAGISCDRYIETLKQKHNLVQKFE